MHFSLLVFLTDEKCINNVGSKQSEHDSCGCVKDFIVHPVRQLPEQGLQQVEKHHAADAEADARVQGDPSLQVEGKSCLVPQPAALGELHNIAGDQLHYGGDHNDADKDKKRCDRDPAQIQLFLLEAA